MTITPKSPMNILIAGDLTMDWNLARQNRGPAFQLTWNPEDSTTMSWQPGGSALLGNLVTTIASDLSGSSNLETIVHQPGTQVQPVTPSDPRFHHSFAIWSPYKQGSQRVWRVSEFLGIDPIKPAEPSPPGPIGEAVPNQADFLILDDADLGFRDTPALWPAALNEPDTRPWVLLKMSEPVGHGPLWEHLIRDHADRLIVLTTVQDLRRTEVQISQGLSWERTSQDLVWELRHNPEINTLFRCACVVVSFGAAGAVVHTRLKGEGEISGLGRTVDQLVFDPGVIEGTWEAEHPGGMIGYTTCLVGGIAREWILSRDLTRIAQGVSTGLEAMRDLHQNGYQVSEESGKPQISFPLRRTSKILSQPGRSFTTVHIQDPVRFLNNEPDAFETPPKGGYWNILEERYQGDLTEISAKIVMMGAENALTDVPQGIFGGLFTVDRQEIESFRAISTLAGEYLSQAKPKRPLSIAVFGAPGSGKSFGITQVAKSLAPGRIQVLEFNLSQFGSPDELSDAFHQVRDINLKGQFPLVFWDEFDTPLENTPLGWLRYFLAPMQDGKFREGQLVHPIGPAIFVFAGGTSERMEDFGVGLSEAAIRTSKVPDFISRLKGFVNVLGPNPQGEDDNFYLIRRAILLRSILWRNENQLFRKLDGLQQPDIDNGVLRAFLKTRAFKHGIRSMESVVDMSQLGDNTKFERSSLPSEKQLNIHVDGQEFLSLVQQIELIPETLEKLAEAFHNHFCDQLRKDDYKYGPVTDEVKKTHSSLVSYNQLPEHEREQNRDTVRHIQDKLAASGYIMIPARSDQRSFTFPEGFLKQLAIMEHDRWMRLKFSQNWKPGDNTNKAEMIHQDLVTWDELSKSAQEKDINFVLAIPGILAQAGYTVVKLR